MKEKAGGITVREGMEYGVSQPDWQVPDGFRALYPCRYAYGYLEQEGGPVELERPALVYVIEGEGGVRAQEGEGIYTGKCGIYTCNGKSLVFHAASRTEYYYIQLENAEPFPVRLPQQLVYPLGDESGLEWMLERMCFNAQSGRTGNLYEASADAFRLIMKFCEQCVKKKGYSELVQDAMECMREEYAFLTGIEDLAGRVGVTKSHLIRVFSAETGMTPGKFLETVRLENAMLLLRGREYTVDMVAGLCGFSGANYFCKVFRRATGESPGSYRGRCAGEAPTDLENKRRLLEMERRQLI